MAAEAASHGVHRAPGRSGIASHRRMKTSLTARSLACGDRFSDAEPEALPSNRAAIFSTRRRNSIAAVFARCDAYGASRVDTQKQR